MRIGLLAYGVTRGHTGIGRYAVQLSRALKRLHPEAHLVLLTPYRRAPLRWYGEFPVHHVPGLRLMPAVATLGNVVLHRAAHRLRLDVLHDPCGIAPFLAPHPGHARVVTVHDAIPLTHPHTQPVLTRLVYHTLVRRAGRSADAILTVSENAAEDLVRHLRLPREKIFVTPNGVSVPVPRHDYEALATSVGAREPFLLCVGALHPRKNVGRVVEGFRRAHERHPELSLVIAGPPSWGAHRSLAEVVAAARAHPAIHFTGYVEEEVLHALYRRATALVLASLYEGFGLPALEAMAHGTPVVASNGSSLPEVVGDAGLLVDPLDVTALAGAMERLVRDGDLRARLGRVGRLRAETFNWGDTARRTWAVYEAVVAARQAGAAASPHQSEAPPLP